MSNPHIKKIKVWVPNEEKGHIFPGEKYNIDPEKIEFTEDELEASSEWTFAETVELFANLRSLNYNFIILADR